MQILQKRVPAWISTFESIVDRLKRNISFERLKQVNKYIQSNMRLLEKRKDPDTIQVTHTTPLDTSITMQHVLRIYDCTHMYWDRQEGTSRLPSIGTMAPLHEKHETQLYVASGRWETSLYVSFHVINWKVCHKWKGLYVSFHIIN